MSLQSLLAQGEPLLLDGAMGTYLAQQGWRGGPCEWATLRQPELVHRAHRAYAQAGARVLRTNSFAANARALGGTRQDALAVTLRALDIARRAAGDQAVAALSLGPMPGYDDPAEALDERLWLLERCLAEGADAFWFETFAQLEPLLPCAAFLRRSSPRAFIAATFACSADGYTRAGLSVARALNQLGKEKAVDICGLNCGLGPTHLVSLLRALPAAAREGLPLAALPNAGYPRGEGDRASFSAAPGYFADTLVRALPLGARLLGGCCGTTPDHIRALGQAMAATGADCAEHSGTAHAPAPSPARAAPAQSPRSRLSDGMAQGRFVTLAELEPPRHGDLSGFLQAAYRLQVAGVDALTVPDSPLARARMSSVLCGAQVMHSLGMETVPHLCCRDRNINALHGDLLGAHASGLRAVLAVTGDPIPESDRGHVHGVFNLTSAQLAGHISRMNRDLFADDPLTVGVAFHPGAAQPQVELKRLVQKQAQGARFVMTQPLFDPAALSALDAARAMGLFVLAGIMPLVSLRNAQYMHNEVPGIRIPDAYLAHFEAGQSRDEAAAAGVAIAAEIAAWVRPHADGFYIMTPFQRADVVCALLERLREDGTLA
ncbi:MAG: bifunctional homocysteine S-methyltransferase/methylenetetrahydrofolate reductase [Oscillospiraceae bacterium]|nr:bifunctional homocysteine S-methyltransferase/methylenetetrahydrofolate reductase [Oscillospiraceae bacterium]